MADLERQSFGGDRRESVDVHIRERFEIRDVPRLDDDSMLARELCPIEAGIEVVGHVLELREVPRDLRVYRAKRREIDRCAQMAPRVVVASGDQFRFAKGAKLLRRLLLPRV